MFNFKKRIQLAATDQDAAELFDQAINTSPDKLPVLWAELLATRPEAAKIVEKVWPAIRVVANNIRDGHGAF
jgi:hypothetical protein